MKSKTKEDKLIEKTILISFQNLFSILPNQFLD